ncbi:MAG TPA: adenylate kinase [Vicinamibacterales bacterium]|nr:adenylate kinase [Vicinamibacterales bacterium]
MALNLVMLGPPGAGKGTQAERFAREHGIPKISTGDILREAVHSDSELGRAVKDLMARGELVGDELIIGIVRERLSRPDAMAGFVLDGFPRTATQAKALDEITASRGPVICVEIQVPDDELVRRVRSRRVCEDCGANADAFEHKPDQVPDLCQNTDRCRSVGPKWVARSDDSESIVRERLKIYWRDTRPMIDFYSSRPTFRAIDGKQTPEQVREALVSAVASALGKPASQLRAQAKKLGVQA